MIKPQKYLLWLLMPSSVGLLILTIAPSRWSGIDLGAIGTGLLLLTAWAGLWLATRRPASSESAISPGEQKNAVALLFTACITAFLIAEMDVIASASSMAELKGLGRVVVALVLGWIVFSVALKQRLGHGVQEDERDQAVERKADAAAHGTTAFLLIGLAVTFAFSPVNRLAWATPLVIAHGLVFVLVLSALVGYLVAASLYWRDRR